MNALTFIETLQSSNVPAAVIANPFGRFPFKKFAKLGVTLSLCEEDDDDDCSRDCAAEVVDCVIGIVDDDGDIDWYSTRDCDDDDDEDDEDDD